MEINFKKVNREFLKKTPYFEEWRGKEGKILAFEQLLVIGEEGYMEMVELAPTYKVGANYAHYPSFDGAGESYETSLKKAGFDTELKTNPNHFLIIQREFRNWSGMKPVDDLTIILVEDEE
jgi:hypothetical protein